MNKNDLARLVDHFAWANRAVIESLASQKEIPRKARAILSHLLAAEDLWLCRINGVPERALPVWPDLSLADCEARCAGNEEAFRKLLDSIDDSGLGRPVAYVNSKGERFENTVQDILIHVCQHGSYHRGQVAVLVREAGGSPINTDYIAWVRSVRQREPGR